MPDGASRPVSGAGLRTPRPADTTVHTAPQLAGARPEDTRRSSAEGQVKGCIPSHWPPGSLHFRLWRGCVGGAVYAAGVGVPQILSGRHIPKAHWLGTHMSPWRSTVPQFPFCFLL